MLRALGAVALLFIAGSSLAIEPPPMLQQQQSPIELTDVSPNAGAKSALKTYVVQMHGKPGVSYDGGLSGFAATAPAPGESYDASAPHVSAYTSHLVALHDEMLSAMGASDRKIYSYCHTMNGFAVQLSPGEAEALRRSGDVLNVWEDYSVQVDTADTPDFLGLNDRRGGLRRDLGLRGENVIVGVLDTGAVQEHPSFSDTLDIELPAFCEQPRGFFARYVCKKLTKLQDIVVYSAPPEDWSGICQPGEGWSDTDCNNKLIGARWYVDGFIAGAGSVVENEFLSPRDSSGHGSHTASTAAGNDVTARLNGTSVGRISGMAPRARLAIYKVCWLAPGATNFSCFFSDSAAATDQAVADGVDVLNFSVGTAASFVDQQDLAFFDASNAGVFVARSGGNSGPGFATTNAGEPWVTTVAASTADGDLFTLAASVNSPMSVAGDYSALEGAITQPLSESGDITADVVAADPIEACTPLTNDLTGQIALIARGACAFTDKVENAVNAGASAVLVYTNDSPKTVMGGTTTDLTSSIPGVMIDQEPGLQILAELANSVVNASINDMTFTTEPREGNIMANFSSRGPYLVEPDWIKPDITAPGVQILAAYSPDQADGSQGDLFDYLSGTSMSGPHIAGLGALIKEAHPDWSPAQIKSALMTTARQDIVKEDGATPADPFDFGAGHVVPNGAVSPGLSYDAGALDYLAASCGTVSPLLTPADCAFIEEQLGLSTNPADLNLPSIGVGELPGSQTVTRTVTAVGNYNPRARYFGSKSNRKQRYTANVEAPPGFDVSVSPSKLSLRPGETASYEVTITNETGAPNVWSFGALTWEAKNRRDADVRSPIAVNAIAFITEDEISGTGAAGSDQFDVTFGYSGPYTAQTHGLNQAAVSLLPPLLDDPDNSFAFSFADPSTFALIIDDVAPGTAFRRWSLYNEYTSGNDDVDLYLYYCPGGSCTQIASSANGGSDESVDVTLPIPFDAAVFNPYVLFVHAFDTEVDSANIFLFDNQFGVVDDAGNLTVAAPSVATVGETVPITFDWQDLPIGPLSKRLGAISHSDANGLQKLTVIDIENDEGFTICDFGLCP